MRLQKVIPNLDNRLQALAYRKTGMSYDDIAVKMGLKNKQVAHRLVQGALKMVIREPAEDVLQIELARLDELYNAAVKRAKEGDLKGIHAALAVMDRRSRLMGLDRKEEKELLYQANVIATMLVAAIKTVVSPETVPLIQAAFAKVLQSGMGEVIEAEYSELPMLPGSVNAGGNVDIEDDDAEV